MRSILFLVLSLEKDFFGFLIKKNKLIKFIYTIKDMKCIVI